MIFSSFFSSSSFGTRIFSVSSSSFKFKFEHWNSIFFESVCLGVTLFHWPIQFLFFTSLSLFTQSIYNNIVIYHLPILYTAFDHRLVHFLFFLPSSYSHNHTISHTLAHILRYRGNATCRGTLFLCFLYNTIYSWCTLFPIK